MMKKEIQKFIEYIKKYKNQIIFIYILAILTYVVKLFFYSVSIDNEVPVNNINANDFPWIATGRWGVVFFEKIMHYGGRFNPIFNNFIMILFLVFSVIIMSYLIDKICKKEHNYNLSILGGFVITSPTLAEMMNFSLMNAEVAIGLFLVVLSIHLLYNAIYENKKAYYIFSTIALTIAMGEYQAFFPLFIGLITFIFSLEKFYGEKETKFKQDVVNILKIIGVFAISYVCCSLITYFLEKIFNLNTSGYLTNQITWGKISLYESVQNIKEYVKMVVFPKNSIYFNYSYLIVIIGYIIFCIHTFIKKKSKSILSLLSLFISIISPFLLTILMANFVVMRSQMNLPFVVGLFTILFIDKLYSKKIIRLFLYICCTIFCLIQFKSTEDLFYSDYNRYKEDVRLTQDIMVKIDLLENLSDSRENMKIVFLGHRSPDSTSVSIKGETMGNSFYEWDASTEFGSNIRIYGLTQTLGYKYISPSLDDIKKAKKMLDKMDVYPSKNSIITNDNMIIVRLS